MTPKNYSIVITDTSCFIILQKINALHLLNELFTAVVTTPQIAAEFGSLLPDWVLIQKVNNSGLFNDFNQYVDEGEASAIALAKEIKYDYLIIDDAAARKFAERQGMKVKGTVGLILMAKQKGIIPLLQPYLNQIQQTNFRISSALIKTILKEAGEIS